MKMVRFTTRLGFSLGVLALVGGLAIGCSSPSSAANTTPSSAKALTAFSIVNPQATGTISGTSIAVTVPFGTAVTSLVASFTTTGSSVKVGGTTQVSGTTANDFTNPVTYTVTAADATTQTYTVTVTPSVSSVTPVTASALALAGVTSGFPASETDLQNLFTAISNDHSSASNAEGQAISNDLSNSTAQNTLQTAFNNFGNSLNSSFLTSKSASLSATLAASDAGSLINISAANLTGKLTAATFDGQAIANDSSNLQSLVATLSASFKANIANPSTTTAVSQGPVRDAQVAFNFGAHASGTASTAGVFSGSANVNGSVAVEVDYSISATIGLSINEGGQGGKIIANATSNFTNTQTINNPASATLSTTLNNFVSGAAPLTVTVSVYDDSNLLQNTFTYTTTLSSLSSSLVSVLSSS